VTSCYRHFPSHTQVNLSVTLCKLKGLFTRTVILTVSDATAASDTAQKIGRILFLCGVRCGCRIWHCQNHRLCKQTISVSFWESKQQLSRLLHKLQFLLSCWVWSCWRAFQNEYPFRYSTWNLWFEPFNHMNYLFIRWPVSIRFKGYQVIKRNLRFKTAKRSMYVCMYIWPTFLLYCKNARLAIMWSIIPIYTFYVLNNSFANVTRRNCNILNWTTSNKSFEDFDSSRMSHNVFGIFCGVSLNLSISLLIACPSFNVPISIANFCLKCNWSCRTFMFDALFFVR
jgi:hypothetical protein